MIPGWVALLALLLTVAGGAWIAYRYGYRDGLEEANEPICGCGHHRAFHKGVGECAWHPDGYSTWVCPCQGYIGPEAVPEFLWPHVEKEADK